MIQQSKKTGGGLNQSIPPVKFIFKRNKMKKRTTKEIMELLEKQSVRPLENIPLLEEYISASLEREKTITFFNWECPPRVLDSDAKGKPFVNYCVNLEKIFKGEKLDDFTELPRVVEQKEREIELLKKFKNWGLTFRFVKIIADTNAYYITPDSIDILGERRVVEVFLDFKRRIDEITERDYPLKVNSCFFSELICPIQDLYENWVQQALRQLKANPEKLISQSIWDKELKYLKEHMGFDSSQKDELLDFARKVVATYCSEGMIFDRLSQTEEFSSCIWLNIEEAIDASVGITNGLRKLNNLGPMPMVF